MQWVKDATSSSCVQLLACLLRRVSSSRQFFSNLYAIFFLLKVKVYLFHTYRYCTLYVILTKTTHDNYYIHSLRHLLIHSKNTLVFYVKILVATREFV